jgi:glycosyltransferase involved in cell wall biosynthesis
MKISACFAVHNEIETVKKCWPVSKSILVNEWLIADNGSTDGVGDYIRDVVDPDVFIKFKENVGIARSHNPLFAQASGDLVVLTGCNRIPPDGWATKFRTYFQTFPDLVAACIYNDKANQSERVSGHSHSVGKLPLLDGILMDVICFRKEIFKHVGYYDLGFGLYGYEDLEFSARIQSWCGANGKFAGVIPDLRNRHMGFVPTEEFDPSKCSEYYYNLKKSEWNKNTDKEKRFMELADHGFPYFSPY